MSQEPSEKDFLQYKGNTIPRILRLAWTLFVLFGVYYLAINMIPDLKVWMGN